jgi:hypothetical protein
MGFRASRIPDEADAFPVIATIWHIREVSKS